MSKSSETAQPNVAKDRTQRDHAEWFGHWVPGASPAEVGAKLAELFSDSPLQDENKHYKDGCAWYGALGVAAQLGDQALLQALTEKYAPYLNSYAQLLNTQGHVDENLFGIVPLQIAQNHADPIYLNDGLALAEHQMKNIEAQTRGAMDDMFMITGLQVQAYRASGRVAHLELAARTMQGYLAAQQEDGLFFQMSQKDSQKWSRGNGWVAAGMTELLRELDGLEVDPGTAAARSAIRSAYQALMAGLLRAQIQHGAGAGLWYQVLDSEHRDNWPETSGSAMFTYALVTGVKRGWLPSEQYGPAARAAWDGLVAFLEPDGRLRNVSRWVYGGSLEDYVYRHTEGHYYRDMPGEEPPPGDNHGQAPLMWTAAALLR